MRGDARRLVHWTGIVALAAAFGLTACGDDPPTPDFALTVTPGTISLLPQENAGAAIGIERTHFPGYVTLSLQGAPDGVEASFSPYGLNTGAQAALSLRVGASVVPGRYAMTVHGSSDVGERDQPLTLVVKTPPDGFWVVAPAAIALPWDSSVSVNVRIVRGTYEGPVSMTFTGLPEYVTAAFNPTEVTGTTTTLRLQVGPRPATAPSMSMPRSAEITGTGAPGTRTAPLAVRLGNLPPRGPMP